MTLTAREQQTLRAYQEFLLQRVPNQIERLVLFGSKARAMTGRIRTSIC